MNDIYKENHKNSDKFRRYVIIGGADIGDYSKIKTYIESDDYIVYCDSGLRHEAGLGIKPSLIVGDFDSYEDPGYNIETIKLPVAKDDTDTVYASKEGMRRGFKEFLLIGAVGARLDHTLVNTYILSMLENNGCHGLIVDDYSEIELIANRISDIGDNTPGAAFSSCDYPYFSLLAIEGPAKGVSIKNAKFPLEDAVIEPWYQYATSNEALPGQTAEIEVKDGRLLFIKIIPGAEERHDQD